MVSGRIPPPGIGFPGKPSCQRICIASRPPTSRKNRSEEHTSELQSQSNLVCRLLLEKKKDSLNSSPVLFSTHMLYPNTPCQLYHLTFPALGNSSATLAHASAPCFIQSNEHPQQSGR